MMSPDGEHLLSFGRFVTTNNRITRGHRTLITSSPWADVPHPNVQVIFSRGGGSALLLVWSSTLMTLLTTEYSKGLNQEQLDLRKGFLDCD